ncbi:MAG: hypothetical protein K0S41_452 [Anaerocolumna sp.]|jgi:hypothetical protein|nr:hypothetical protein [Anaerocolumna sp.]
MATKCCPYGLNAIVGKFTLTNIIIVLFNFFFTYREKKLENVERWRFVRMFILFINI